MALQPKLKIETRLYLPEIIEETCNLQECRYFIFITFGNIVNLKAYERYYGGVSHLPPNADEKIIIREKTVDFVDGLLPKPQV